MISIVEDLLCYENINSAVLVNRTAHFLDGDKECFLNSECYN